LKYFFFFDPDDSYLTQTTTTNEMTTTATDYWTATAGFVAIRGDELYACEEVGVLTAAKWDEHKFGLCCECDCGLDDEADFVITGNANKDDTVLMCYGCFMHITQGHSYAH
jgi:hypothetical protein